MRRGRDGTGKRLLRLPRALTELQPRQHVDLPPEPGSPAGGARLVSQPPARLPEEPPDHDAWTVKPEDQARRQIDRQLSLAGWIVQDRASLYVDLRRGADAELQRLVSDVRARLAGLVGERR